MAVPFVFTEMLAALVLPYLEQSTANPLALHAVTSTVRALVLRDEPPTLLNAASWIHRAWWYNRGWPARIVVESLDDVVAVVRAGVTNVSDISFCGCTVARVYATAAMHYSATVLSIQRAHLRDATYKHVARFERLQTLHCSSVSRCRLGMLPHRLKLLEKIEIDSFEAGAAMDDIVQLFASVKVFPVLHRLPPSITNDERSLFVLSACRLALRLLEEVPRWSVDFGVRTEGVLMSFRDHAHFGAPVMFRNHLSNAEAVVDAIVAMSVYVATANSVSYLSSAIIQICSFMGETGETTRKFGTPPMRDALLSISTHAISPYSVECLSTAISHTSCKSRGTFATPAMRDALVAMSAHATNPTSVAWLSLPNPSFC